MASAKVLDAIQSTSLGLVNDLGTGKTLARFSLSYGEARIVQGSDSLWVAVDIGGRGGCAVRAGYLLGNPILAVKQRGEGVYELSYPAGKVKVEVSEVASCLRVRTWIAPTDNLILPFVPRDFFVLDANGNPAGTEVAIHTSMAGIANPMIYLSLTKPRTGTFFYFQNFTPLNDYFEKTETVPEGSVGGEWPEFGYLMPTSCDKGIPAGQETLVSDALVAFDPQIPEKPKEIAEMFVDFLAQIYTMLEKPPTERHDWLKLARASLADLERAPTASVTYWGCKYLRPYNDAEYPDCMVEANVLHGLRDFEIWCGEEILLYKELNRGIGRFYDKKLKTFRRYLPNVGDDKNPDQVDSWYMYHPLMSLVRLAKDGNKKARKLLFDSLDTAIGFARKFKYRWPVMFDVKTGDVIKQQRREGEEGQTDVAGLYAYLMMDVYNLTRDEQYLEEAKRAVEAISEKCFDIAYQLNTTAWGVPACVRLWHETHDRGYLDQARVFFAAFLRHTIFWESKIKLAKEYSTFLAVLCLDDTRYMAQFECHESYEAFCEALTLGGGDLPESMRLLLTDYCKHALNRAWYYYPRFLPKDGLAKEIRNGKIDPKLHFPLEDLYPAGEAAGQVGQEIYGTGAAFAFLTNAFHHFGEAPFLLFCEYPIRRLLIEGNTARFEITGSSTRTCRLELLSNGSRKATATLEIDGEPRPIETGCPIEVPGYTKVVLSWRGGREKNE